MANLPLKHVWLVAVIVSAGLHALAHAQADAPLPISLDAESSTFDRLSNTVAFRRLSISQGNLHIRADEAVATGLDFEQGTWVFTGNVVFAVDAAHIEADRAEIVFVANQLQSAELTGTPASFEATSAIGAGRIRGGASQLTFDNSARVMHMTDNAWLNDGPNAFSGCNLSYDLEQETITSGSSECGEPVVITIQPRNGDTASESSSSP